MAEFETTSGQKLTNPRRSFLSRLDRGFGTGIRHPRNRFKVRFEEFQMLDCRFGLAADGRRCCTASCRAGCIIFDLHGLFLGPLCSFGKRRKSWIYAPFLFKIISVLTYECRTGPRCDIFQERSEPELPQHVSSWLIFHDWICHAHVVQHKVFAVTAGAQSVVEGLYSVGYAQIPRSKSPETHQHLQTVTVA